ncbi:hypothetical protein [Candidatus Nitrospira allomarina]|uniref:Type II secretion system protein n=1 Tax=Candidatus Nitrospira allomarina TaxID=3020900 RepID=A0AA96GC18_9BACT|nr:hypothetical protein [Candidatus Nitrospira allomarina]WNM59289.1 hypothetical protein PP769_05850 [Candidatus Nitrospira allomarina]
MTSYLGQLGVALPSPSRQPNVSDPEAGMTLIVFIGLLAILSIGLAVVSPSMVRVWDPMSEDRETRDLQLIANGIISYLRQNHAFPPSLLILSPDFAPLPQAQMTRNARGFPRYYAVHPSITGFQNSTGLTGGELINARFLLISHLAQDAAPAITTPASFETWWNMNDSTTPPLIIHRGTVSHLFYMVDLIPNGNGGSFSIDHQPTHSNGALLPTHSRLHLLGTEIGLDEDNSYNIPDFEFSLTTNTGYWFDPLCVPTKRWNPLSPPC